MPPRDRGNLNPSAALAMSIRTLKTGSPPVATRRRPDTTSASPTSQEETSMSTVTHTVPSAAPTAADPGLSPARLNLMRAGFLLMGVGLALVKWPLLPHAASLPFYDGAT